MTDQGPPEIPEPNESDVERTLGRRKMYGLRRRASWRERRRRFEWIAESQRRSHPNEDEAAVYRRAQAQFARLLKEDPKLTAAFLALRPSSMAPDRQHVDPDAELAAAVAHPVVVRVLHAMARTPSRRGKPSDLSFATACLMLMAASGGRSYVKDAISELRKSLPTSWALGRPSLEVCDKQIYKHIPTITGR
jgi:hypothetical protein